MTPNDRKDLILHHRVLKQFLDISDDQPSTRSNSTRATKAREKLLKLSTAQFCELSTDVYDELQRRIDETRGEPDFLLPKSSFHPKRNQARQKLSSLPATRFKDLVTDILFEIERRNLHLRQPNDKGSARDSTNSNTNVTDVSSNSKSTTSSTMSPGISYHSKDRSIDSKDNKFNHSSIGYGSNGNNHLSLNHNSSQTNDLQSSTVGIQPSTVIPTKANLTWSSDEEEDSDATRTIKKKVNMSSNESSPVAARRGLNGNSDKDRDIQVLIEEGTKMDNKINELEAKLNAVTLERDQFKRDALSSQKDKSELMTLREESHEWKKQRSAFETRIGELEMENRGTRDIQLFDEHNSLNENYNKLRRELESLKIINNTLKTENDSLKQNGSLNPSISKHLPGNITNNGNFEDIRVELEKFQERLSNVTPANNDLMSADNPEALKLQVQKWQKRFEEARSSHISENLTKKLFSQTSIRSFVDPNGLISMKSITDLQSAVETYLLYLHDGAIDSDLLFDKVANISIIANDIASQGEHNNINGNEYSALIRAAISHAITSTRYYAIYNNLLPKLVVESSINEIVFTVCDLVTFSKINTDPTFSGTKESSSISREIEASSNPKNNEIDELAGVRPLKTVNKIRSSGASYNSSSENLPDATKPKGFNGSPPTRNVPSFSHDVQSQKSTPQTKGNIAALTSKFSHGNIESPSPISRVASNGIPTVGQAGIPPRMTPVKTNGIASLASRFSQSPENSTDLSPRGSPRGSRDFTPTKQGNILDRVKKFETPSSESVQKKSNHNRTPSALSDDIVGKFGAKRRSSIIESDLVGESKVDSQVPSTEKSVSFTGSNSEQTPQKANIASRTSSEPVASSTISPNTQVISSPNPNSVKTDDKPLNIVKRSVSIVHAKANRIGSNKQTSNSAGSDTKDATSNRSASDSPSLKSEKSVKPIMKNVVAASAPKAAVDFYSSDSDSEIEEEKNGAPLNISETSPSSEAEEEASRRKQELRKSMAATTFNIELFDIEDPDNTLTQLLLYLEHQTVQVISTIQSLLSSIKKPDSTRGILRSGSKDISDVISQMTEATNNSMNQTRNAQLKEHGTWVVRNLEDCNHRMAILCNNDDKHRDDDYADKNFKQRLAGIAFDIAKCTKELVKTVEEASIKEEIAHLDARLIQEDDLL